MSRKYYVVKEGAAVAVSFKEWKEHMKNLGGAADE